MRCARRGVVLLEVMVAIVVLAIGLAGLWPLMLQLSGSTKISESAELRVHRAEMRLWYYSTLSARELMQRAGTTVREDGTFEHIQRNEGGTFTVSIRTRSGVAILETVLFPTGVERESSPLSPSDDAA